MKKRILILTLSLLVILTVSGCLEHLGYNSKENINDNYTHDSFFKNDLEIEFEESEIYKRYIQTDPPIIKINKKPQFNIGDVFVYTWDVYGTGDKNTKYFKNRLTGKKIFIHKRYMIKKKEIINDSEYYVIKSSGEYADPSGDPVIEPPSIIYVNTVNGSILNKRQYHSCCDFFAPWMLALTDNFSFEVRTHSMYYSHEDDINKTNMTFEDYIITTYKVIGRDDINDRECFKVEVNDDDGILYYCIDVEKRIALETPSGYLVPEDELIDT